MTRVDSVEVDSEAVEVVDVLEVARVEAMEAGPVEMEAMEVRARSVL